MLARLVDDLPAGPGWLYEPKWDGFRCIAKVLADGAVRLLSRRGTSLDNAFPDIVSAASRQLPPGTIADGEIVRWSTTGQLDFEALQRRNRSAGRGARNLARTEPCHLILFDLLRLQDHDLTRSPLTDRRAELEQLLDDTGAAVLVAGMQTDDLEVARVWFDQLAAVGVEGIVAKRADEPYRPGTRSWVRIKHYATTEAIVGGVTGPLKRPESLVLGRFDATDGQLHIVGRSTELHPTGAEPIAAAIKPAGNDHPWPAQLPPSWHDRAARDYHRVIPDLIVEVRVDVATAQAIDGPSHWRHRLRLLRLRTDLNIGDVPRDLNIERPD
jgi:ATP-dependent DNA ligase